jgi:hypothetical protein
MVNHIPDAGKMVDHIGCDDKKVFSMRKTSTEILDAHVEYFLTQDFATVCKALANCLLDEYRLSNFKTLTKEQRDSLMARIHRNAESVASFMIHGPCGDLDVRPIEQSDKK